MARESNCYLTKRIKRNIEIDTRIVKTKTRTKIKSKYEPYVNPRLAKKLKERQIKAQRRAKHYLQGKGER